MSGLGDAFYGLCRLWDVQVRQPADVADYVVLNRSGDLYVIVTEHGTGRGGDVMRLRRAREQVVVLDRSKVHELRRKETGPMVLQQLWAWAHEQALQAILR